MRYTPRGIRSRRGFVLEGLSYVILANIWECLDVFLDTELYITLFVFVRDRLGLLINLNQYNYIHIKES